MNMTSNSRVLNTGHYVSIVTEHYYGLPIPVFTCVSTSTVDVQQWYLPMCQHILSDIGLDSMSIPIRIPIMPFGNLHLTETRQQEAEDPHKRLDLPIKNGSSIKRFNCIRIICSRTSKRAVRQYMGRMLNHNSFPRLRHPPRRNQLDVPKRPSQGP